MIPTPAWLFCPADRPDRFANAAAAADTVIVDLEDSVLSVRKELARTHVQHASLDPAATIVRINAADTPDHLLDLAALAATPYRNVMLPKTEHVAALDRLADAGYRVVALCETALGILNAAEIARHPAVTALMWGAEDLLVSLGGRSSRNQDGQYRDISRHARSQGLLAARAAGKVAVDAVHLDIDDLDGLREEAADAAAVGFAASGCIHPRQVPVIRAAYQPTAEETEWAASLLADAGSKPGTFRFRGRMIDEPVLRQARTILERGRHGAVTAR